MTFEETIAFTGIDKWIFTSEDWKEKAKKVYVDLSKRWNINQKPQFRSTPLEFVLLQSTDYNKILSFAAVTLCYVSIPYRFFLKNP
jgi:hypothetical protein